MTYQYIVDMLIPSTYRYSPSLHRGKRVVNHLCCKNEVSYTDLKSSVRLLRLLSKEFRGASLSES